QNHISDGGSFRKKHILHYQETPRQSEGINVELAYGIGANYIKCFQVTCFRALDHLGQSKPRGARNFSPFFVKFASFIGTEVSGKQIRIKAHVCGATRVGMVTQADKFGSWDASAELHKRSDIAATNL